MAIVNQSKCVGCKKCLLYCPMAAISIKEKKAFVDQDECVECGICLNQCKFGALSIPELSWPRNIRSELSNPKCPCKTGVLGRSTEEMKTNDVTGRFKEGEVGLCAELGRPGTGARISELEKVAMALAKVDGIEFEPCNPITALMVDNTGKMREDVLQEKIMSGIVEVKFPVERTREVLTALKEVEPTINTVFSVDMITVVYPDGSQPPVEIAREMGIDVYPNCKTNMGIGCHKLAR